MRCKGFTLVEILVVIIIVGVLASVALPSLFRNIEHSRAAEALNTLGIIQRSLEACSMQFNGDFTSCASYQAIGMSDPSASAGHPDSHFDYVINGPSITILYQLVAQRTTLDNGDTSDLILITKANNGGLSRAGSGAFASIK
jgi:prepilin-type N-terminal cleavage/methylation domain-containing protein